MKKHLITLLSFSFFLLLFGCTTYPITDVDYTQETWQRQVITSPSKWTRGADSWFLTGDPNQAELNARHAGYGSAISTMAVRVPDFTNLKVNGDFQVQIFGSDGHNSVYVYGPNAGVHQLSVEMRGNTLWVNQVGKVPVGQMKQVIVRIGVRHLDNLSTTGCAQVEGVRLRSSHLNITAAGSGNIYLAGNLNLRCVIQAGTGNVTVFGANTSSLEVRTTGCGGSVNICGYVGLKSILHTEGSTDINIIGVVPCQPLSINANGSGRISISGLVNLKDIRVAGDVCVYIARTQSNCIYVSLNNNAKVGIAGCAQKLIAETFGKSVFAGRYLCPQTAFVKAHGQSHINVGGGSRVYASSTDASSVYFFGPGAALSKFAKDNGTVVVLSNNGNSCFCGGAQLQPVQQQYVGAG